MKKDEFSKTWGSLVDNFNKLVEITEVNRRLISGIATKLIEKEIMSAEDIVKIENEVSESLKQKK